MQLGPRDPSNEVGGEVFSGLLVYTMAYAHSHTYTCTLSYICRYIYTHIYAHPHIHALTQMYTQYIYIYSLSIHTYTDTYKDAVFYSRNLKNISRGINYEFGNIVNSKRTILKSSNDKSVTVIIKVELSIGLRYVRKASEANVAALSRWLGNFVHERGLFRNMEE